MREMTLDVWNSSRGMPFNGNYQIKKTASGYIVVTSYDGLLRFDGNRFDMIDKNELPDLKLGSIVANAFYEDEEQNYWLYALENGAFKGKNGRFEKVYALDSLKSPANYFFQIAKNQFIIGTRGDGVYLFDEKQNSLSRFDNPELSKGNFISIEKIAENTFWLGTEENGIWLVEKNKISRINENITENLPKTVNVIKKDKKGRIWLGTRRGLFFAENGKLQELYSLSGKLVSDVVFAPDGRLFISATHALYAYNEQTGKTERFGSDEGLPIDDLRDLDIDDYGNIWISSYKMGIARLRVGNFLNLLPEKGLSKKPVNAVIENLKSGILVGNDAAELLDCHIDTIRKIEVKSFVKDRIKCLFKDSGDNIWIGHSGGVLKIQPDGKEIAFGTENILPENTVRVVCEDNEQTIWIGLRNSGLIGLKKDGNIIRFSKENGLNSNFIMDILLDKSGRLIVGTNTGGVNIIEKNGNVSHFTPKEGLASNLVFRMYVDAENNVWVSSNVGFSRIKNGKASSVAIDKYLPVSALYDIKEDGLGYFWLTSNKGVFRVKKTDCEALLDRKSDVLPFKMFNKFDGMASEECNPTAQNFLDKDGLLWFATIEGVSYIDTKNINMNEKLEPVIIEKIVIDDKPLFVFGRNNPIVLADNVQRVVFKYTSPYLYKSEKLTYYYKLEGFDKEWKKTHEQEISYTNLSPRSYTFLVKACNEDGFCTEMVTALSVTKEAYFYQTVGFWVLVAVIFLAVLYAIYTYRVRQIKKNEYKLAQLVELRTAEINLQKEELLAQRDRIEEQKIQIEKSYHKLNTVSEIGQKVTAVLNYEELTALLYAQVNKLLRADGFGIGLYNPKWHRLDFRGFIENNEVLPFSFDLLSESDKHSVRCFQSQEMILVNDRHAESAKNEHFEPSKHGKEAAALIYLPLKIESETLGVITVQSFEKNVYRDYHLMTFQALASYIAIALANTKAYEIIHEKNRNITDSIRYAMTIQNSILPNEEELSASFEEFFVIYKPKDIVSGDFYWHYSAENLRCFAVVDCTGHGVPGAFMSLIGNMLLNEIVHVLHILQPDKILEKLNSELKKSLKQSAESGNDGMDVCLLALQNLDENSVQIQFAGAKRPIYYSENGKIAEIKGSKKSIGAVSSEDEVIFQNEIFTLKKGEKLYLSTDGFADQADDRRQKFGSANLRKLLEKNLDLPLNEQKERIENALLTHSGQTVQRDDITLIGLKL